MKWKVGPANELFYNEEKKGLKGEKNQKEKLQMDTV